MSAEDATTQCVPAVLKTARILDLVALGQRTDPGAPFLIRGEPGVGKDVLARLIHAASERQRYSFIKVNCAVRSADRCEVEDRKSTRLNSSHTVISYAVFCLKKKKQLVHANAQ